MANRTAHRIRASTRVKALGENGRVGGYLVVWGDASRPDLQGEYFTPDTDLGLDWYPRRPVLYHHGLDGDLGPVMIGQIEVMQPDYTGVWVEAQLDLHNRWARAVLDLVQQDALGWSSGSLPHLVDVAAGRVHPALAGRRRQPDSHALPSRVIPMRSRSRRRF